MKDIIMSILLGLVQFGVITLTLAALNFLIHKTGDEKLKKYLNYAKMAVMSIEQTMGSGNGAAKKAAVESFLMKTMGNRRTIEEIDHLIEAAVYEMNVTVRIKAPDGKGQE